MMGGCPGPLVLFAHSPYFTGTGASLFQCICILIPRFLRFPFSFTVSNDPAFHLLAFGGCTPTCMASHVRKYDTLIRQSHGRYGLALGISSIPFLPLALNYTLTHLHDWLLGRRYCLEFSYFAIELDYCHAFGNACPG